MKEENVDERIERVIRSVAAKKKDMAMWNTENAKIKLRNKQIRIFGLSAVASVAIIAVVGIWYLTFYWKESGPKQDLSPSYVSYEYSAKQPSYDYSSEDSDIIAVESLIDSKRYEEALEAIEAILADTIIDSKLPMERKNQIRMLQEDKAYELEWIKIQTLIKLNRKTEALDLLTNYVEMSGPNQIKAKELMDELNNN